MTEQKELNSLCNEICRFAIKDNNGNITGCCYNEISKRKDFQRIYNTPMDTSNFEPVDSQGYTVEGSVEYDGREYFIHYNCGDISDNCLTLQEEITMQIYEEIYCELPFGVLPFDEETD